MPSAKYLAARQLAITNAMAKVEGLEDLFTTPAAPIWSVVDGSQPCNTGDPYTKPGRERRDLFHPDVENRDCATPADDCARCPFRVPCQHYAVRHERRGYWGGLTAKDRELIRSELGIELDSPARDFLPDPLELVRQLRKAEAIARQLNTEYIRNERGQIIGQRQREVAA
jgi:hypothetical protein